MRVLVLGGAGNFGARIVRALQRDSQIELLIGGRRGGARAGSEDVRSVALDLTSASFGDRLRALSPALVINCTGPFQSQDYRVVLAVLEAGAHYLDLADGRDFVTHFPAHVNAAAIAAGRVAITGASTLPALSAAVVEELSGDLSELRSIETIIAPGQRAPRGRATLEGVFSYLGRPFPVWRDGCWQQVFGWMDLRRVRLDIGNRLAAACDVPDLALFPEHFRGVRTVTFHAALELAVQHLALWCLAALRRIGVPFPVGRWAVALNRIAGLFDLGAGTEGGMCVSVVGNKPDGTPVSRSWQLTAPALNGPEIPCMPAILLAQGLARGRVVRSGAYPCMGFLRLSDFEPEFARWGISTRIVEMVL
jgi:hypothetical protein